MIICPNCQSRNMSGERLCVACRKELPPDARTEPTEDPKIERLQRELEALRADAAEAARIAAAAVAAAEQKATAAAAATAAEAAAAQHRATQAAAAVVDEVRGKAANDLAAAEARAKTLVAEAIATERSLNGTLEQPNSGVSGSSIPPAPPRLARNLVIGAFVAVLVVAGLGWGVALSAIRSLSHQRPAVGGLVSELQAKDQQIGDLSGRLAAAEADVSVLRRRVNERVARPTETVARVQPAPDTAGLTAQIRALRTQLASRDANEIRLRARLGDLRDVVGAEQRNYNDTLASLHKAQSALYAARGETALYARRCPAVK